MGGYLVTAFKDILTEYNTAFDEGRQAKAQTTAKQIEARNAALTKKQDLIFDITKNMLNSDVPYVGTDGEIFQDAVANAGGLAQYLDSDPNGILNILSTFRKKDKTEDKKEDPERKAMIDQFNKMQEQINKKEIEGYSLDTSNVDATGLGGEGPQGKFVRFKNFKTSDFVKKAIEAGRYNEITQMALMFSSINNDVDEKKTDEKADEKLKTLYTFNSNDSFSYFEDPNASNAKDYYKHMGNIVDSLVTNKDNILALEGEELQEFSSAIRNTLNINFDRFKAGLKIEVKPDVETPEVQFNALAKILEDAGLDEYADMFTSFDNGFLSEKNKIIANDINEKNSNEIIDKDSSVVEMINTDGQKIFKEVPPEIENKFADVVRQLGYKNVLDLYTANNSYYDPNFETLELAQVILSQPGFLTVTKDNKITSVYNTGSVQSVSPDLQKELGLKLARADGDVANKIFALQLAINDNTTSIGTPVQAGTSIPVPTRIMNIINKKTGNKGVSEINAKITLGEELQGLLTDFSSQMVAGDTFPGAAGEVDKFLSNLLGTSGQLVMLGEVFSGTQVSPIELNIDSEDMDGTGIKFINAYVGKHSKIGLRQGSKDRGYAYGRQAALRIFIAYKMAKYFDPSGRVSDRDLQNQLDAFAGSGLSSGTTAAGQASIALERVNDELALLKSLSYDPTNVSKLDVTRLKAGEIYFSTVNTRENQLASYIDNWQFQDDQHTLVPARTPSGKTKYIDGKVAYEVMYKDLSIDNNGKQVMYQVFQQYGGLVVTQNEDTGDYEPVDIRKLVNDEPNRVSSKEENINKDTVKVIPVNTNYDGNPVYEITNADGSSFFVTGNSAEELTGMGIEKLNEMKLDDNITKSLELTQ